MTQTQENTADTKRQYTNIKSRYNNMSEEVQKHFEHLPKIIEYNLPLEIALAYVFLKMEQGQNRALRYGVVLKHRGDSDKVRDMVEEKHLTRKEFQRLFNNVFGEKIHDDTLDKIEEAEDIRDSIIHGKTTVKPSGTKSREKITVKSAKIRKAVVDVLEYSELINEQVNNRAQFKPFGDLRGDVKNKKPLLEGTTYWLMKGLGFGDKDGS